MFQIEIEIDPKDDDAFDNIFWRFCAERLRGQLEPKVDVRPSHRNRLKRRILTFEHAPDAMAFRRQWSLFEDACVDWERRPQEAYMFGALH